MHCGGLQFGAQRYVCKGVSEIEGLLSGKSSVTEAEGDWLHSRF